MNNKTVLISFVLAILAVILGLSVYIVTQNPQKTKPEIPSLQNLTKELDSALQESASLNNLLDSN